MIRSCLLTLLAVLCVSLPASADTRAVYTVPGIPVDERAPSVIEAQQKALAAARLEGAFRIVEKLTLPEDRAVLNGIEMDQETADRMTVAVDVEQETRGGGRYVGVLSVVFNPREVRTYLETRELPYVDRQAPLSLIVPLGGRKLRPDAAVVPDTGADPMGNLPDRGPDGMQDGGEAAGADDASDSLASPDDQPLTWETAWPERAAEPLAPFVSRPGTDYPEQPEYADLAPMIEQAGAERGVIARLVGRPDAYAVDVTLVTQAGNLPLGRTSYVPTLEEAVDAASNLLSTHWKRQSVVRTDTLTPVEANVLYGSITEWTELRRALARSPRVKAFQTVAVARDGALVRFAYGGERQRLESELRQRGIAVDADPSGWVISKSLSGLPRLPTVPSDGARAPGTPGSAPETPGAPGPSEAGQMPASR